MLAVALSMGQVLCSQEASPNRIDSGSYQMLASSDVEFLMTVFQLSLGEIQLGELAAERAAAPDIKTFGQRTATEYEEIRDKLQLLARQRSLHLAAIPTAADATAAARLSSLTGLAFDEQYLRIMPKRHRKQVARFRKEAKSGKDLVIRKFAVENQPMIQDQLAAIKVLAAQSRKKTARH